MTLHIVLQLFSDEPFPVEAYQFNRKERTLMAKRCNPSSKVSNAGKTLSTSRSSSRKTTAAKILNNHKKSNH